MNWIQNSFPMCKPVSRYKQITLIVRCVKLQWWQCFHTFLIGGQWTHLNPHAWSNSYTPWQTNIADICPVYVPWSSCSMLVEKLIDERSRNHYVYGFKYEDFTICNNAFKQHMRSSISIQEGITQREEWVLNQVRPYLLGCRSVKLCKLSMGLFSGIRMMTSLTCVSLFYLRSFPEVKNSL